MCVYGIMSNVESTTGAFRPWGAFTSATAIVAVGAYFLVAGLDPFLLVGLLPSAVATFLLGTYASRHDAWPSKWPLWVVAAIVIGLILYGGSYWLYDLAHPPEAAVPVLHRS